MAEQMRKIKTISGRPLDQRAEMELINRYTLKELKPEDVYAFSVVLCDNEIDRDNERFDRNALEALAKLFIGKTGIFNHSSNAHDQVARLYRASVEQTGERNSLGEEKLALRGFAYILRTEEMQPIIDKIEGGILKEVSVGFAVSDCVCSICGKSIGWSECEDGHVKGRSYNGRRCYGLLKNPVDAYEFSFVAVPAQRGAGVTKNYQPKEIEAAFDVLLGADLRPYLEQMALLEKQYKIAQQSQDEQDKRQEILAENKKYVREM